MLSETLKTYLKVLEIYDDVDVQEACARLTREAREFPPTAGEVRAMCEKIVVARTPRPLAIAERPLADDVTPEQRAANVRRFKELLAEIGERTRMDAPPVSKPRPAPFDFGPSLMADLEARGMVKKPPPPPLEDDDAPAF